ncbi:MAG: hypothetical protein A4E56_02816 [Pelotomaculum sp. PtaU1.Bin065]|nr:MAG: hypothetical protein A4E56_02816 [Pelotomaculum sp. PtaU1.Bin065]
MINSKIFEIASDLQTLWGILIFAFIITSFIILLVAFRKRVNYDSSKQIDIFERNKKYIPSLYIELNDTKENLRYFACGNRWKKRIIRDFNLMFSNYNGIQLKKKLGYLHAFKISSLISYKTLLAVLESYHSFFSDMRNERTELREKFGDYYFVLERLGYDYSKKIAELISFCKMSLSKKMLIVGSAGNGKTNILCNYVKFAMNQGCPCIFINAKDINIDCLEFLNTKLKLPAIIAKYRHLYINIINFLLFCRRKFLFIIIDALNENDAPVFINSISELTDFFNKYSRIKLLYSCRSEFFDFRYKSFFDKCLNPPTVFNVRESDYDDRAKKHLLLAYGKYFNFSGSISKNVESKLFRSLLLMRIFFEVNSGLSQNVIELHDAEIYKKYIDNITSNNRSFDLLSIINHIAEIMVKHLDFNGVEISKLNLSTQDKKSFKDMLDDNILMSYTLHKNKGLITEETVEIVYFVFDELRDFCITRYILSNCKDENDSDYNYFFSVADELYKNKMSPLEGILKYAYIYFKQLKKYYICKKILDSYSNTPIYKWKYNRDWLYRDNEIFYNFGMSIIFSDVENLKDYEKVYIYELTKNNVHDFWNMFFYLLRNDIDGILPSTELVLEVLSFHENYRALEKLIKPFFDDRNEKDEEERHIYILCQRLEKIEEIHGFIPTHLKQFLLLIYAINPEEYLLDNYIGIFINEHDTYEQLINMMKNHEIKIALEEVKNSFSK